jgi:hypothetical protein
MSLVSTVSIPIDSRKVSYAYRCRSPAKPVLIDVNEPVVVSVFQNEAVHDHGNAVYRL